MSADDLRLTPYHPADAPVLFEADQDPEHRRRFDFPADFTPSLPHAQEVIAGWEAQRIAGERFTFAVRSVATGELLGGVELRPLGDGAANLSYWTAPRHRRRGVATRAVALLCRMAFLEMGFKSLRILADPDNLASRRVAVRNGFLEAGQAEGRILYTRMKDYRLVPATASDRDWLEKLRRDVYQDLFVATWGGWDEARHRRHFEECVARGNIQVIEAGCERVGMVQVFEAPDAIEVAEIQVRPEHQNRGVGTSVLTGLMARARGARKPIRIRVALKNDRALRLYKRLGFLRTGQSDTHILLSSAP